MVDLWCADEESECMRPFDRGALIAQLEAHGITFRPVGRATAGITCLLFASVESAVVGNLSAETCSHVLLVAEGDRPNAADADATRDSLGLLGLVEPRAWRSWQRGLFVAWGLYGRSDVAEVAGLAPFGSDGLQPLGDREALPTTLARFLIAAERVLPS